MTDRRTRTAREDTDFDFEVRVTAQRACFTVPAFGAERRTYPFPTPSALKGMFESVFWKPEITYEIARIGVISPGTEVAVTRSELQSRQSLRGSAGVPLRTLRSTSYLQDVGYLVQARIVLREHTPVQGARQSYLEQAMRRLERGAHFQAPYLGLREFAAEVSISDGSLTPNRFLNADVGPVFFGHAYVPGGHEMTFRRKDAQGIRDIEGSAVPLYFNMELRQGWIEVPAALYATIHDMEGRNAA
jgi:CRISPR-associated protein Cas5d